MKALFLTLAFVFSIISFHIADFEVQSVVTGAGGGVEPLVTGAGGNGGVEPLL